MTNDVSDLSARTSAAAPSLSIVVATRNRSKMLAAALEGIKQQTFDSYEVIVVDDASGESTRAEYAALWGTLDSRFKLEFLGSPGEIGLGPSITRNRGITLARGKIVTFCDDDDYWFERTHAATMCSVLDDAPSIGMYIANQRAVSATGQTMKADWLPKLNEIVRSRPQTHHSGHFVSIADLCNSGGFAHLNIVALDRKVLEQTKGFWERVAYEEDCDFFWRAVDFCDQIFFNPTVIGQHNVPDPKKQVNQSTAHSWVERWMLSVLVSQHIAATVSNEAIAKLAVKREGDLYRRLAEHFSAHGKQLAAIQFAKRALATRFSFKWIGYIALLVYKRIYQRWAA